MQQLRTYFLIFLIVFIPVSEVIAATSINKIYQWPYSSTLPYLQPSPNSVATGAHSDVGPGIVIWAVGDIISVVNATDLTEIASIQVKTKNTIKDIYYKAEANSETLYLAVGTNGLQIYDFTDLTSLSLTSEYVVSKQSINNPGYQLDEVTYKSVETYEINATAIGYSANVIYLADMNFGLRVIDVSDIDRPKELLLADPLEIILEEGYYEDPNDPGGIPQYVKRTITVTSGYLQPNVNDEYDVTGGYANLEVITFNGTTYAFVHDYYYGLKVFDVTDPAVISPPVSRIMFTDGWLLYHSLINDLYVTEGTDYDNPSTNRLYAYVTALDSVGSSVVVRLDILTTDGALEDWFPGGSAFQNTGRCITPGDANGVFTIGDHAYVADGTSGLQIADISTGEPLNSSTPPVLDYLVAGSYETSTMAALSLVGDTDNKIYLHDIQEGLHKIDITINDHDDVSTSPSGAGPKASPISINSVYVEDGFAYFLNENAGFRIFDISEPTTLTLEGFYDSSATDSGYDIAVLDNYAYIVKGNDGLEIADVTIKTGPVPVGLMDTAGNAVAVAVYQHSSGREYACVADSDSGLAVIDVSDPTSPDSPEYVAGGTANDVSVSGDFAYIANDSNGLKIVDLSKAPSYTVAGTRPTTGDAVAVSVYNDGTTIYACIAVAGQIIIEDVTNPGVIPVPDTKVIIDPEGDYDVTEFVSLEVKDNYLFAAAESDGVYVYDLSVLPAIPTRLGTFDSNYPSKEVFPFIKDEAYCFTSAEYSSGLSIYSLNLGDPPAEPLGDTGDDAISCFISSVRGQ